jgi:hypothetical protein
MHIDGASVTLLKGINRPNLIVNWRKELFWRLRRLLVS